MPFELAISLTIYAGAKSIRKDIESRNHIAQIPQPPPTTQKSKKKGIDYLRILYQMVEGR